MRGIQEELGVPGDVQFWNNNEWKIKEIRRYCREQGTNIFQHLHVNAHVNSCNPLNNSENPSIPILQIRTLKYKQLGLVIDVANNRAIFSLLSG